MEYFCDGGLLYNYHWRDYNSGIYDGYILGLVPAGFVGDAWIKEFTLSVSGDDFVNVTGLKRVIFEDEMTSVSINENIGRMKRVNIRKVGFFGNNYNNVSKYLDGTLRCDVSSSVYKSDKTLKKLAKNGKIKVTVRLKPKVKSAKVYNGNGGDKKLTITTNEDVYPWVEVKVGSSRYKLDMNFDNSTNYKKLSGKIDFEKGKLRVCGLTGEYSYWCNFGLNPPPHGGGSSPKPPGGR